MDSGLALQKAGTSLPLSPALRAQALSPPQTSGETPTSCAGSGCAAFRAQSWMSTRREGGLDVLTLASTA